MEFMGKIPPHNIKAEQSVLGAMMLDKNAIITAVSNLKANDFYREAHKSIFESAKYLFEKNLPVDSISVMDKLTSDGQLEQVGGVNYLIEITSSCVITSNTLYYSKIISEKANLRRIIKVCSQSIENAYENKNHEELKNSMVEQLMHIRTNDKKTSKLSEAIMEAYEDIEKDHDGKSDNIMTGFTDIDNLTGGIARGDFWLLAARPSMGKSALALNIATNASKTMTEENRKLVGAYFSFEMPKRKLAKRLAFSESLISNNKVKAGKMEEADWTTLAKSCSELSNLKLYIDDNRSNTMTDVKSICYEIKQEESHLDFIMIDHIGIVKPNDLRESRNNQVSQISNDCKTLAMELNCAVVGLNQLSRGVERRDNKRPIMSDLKDSGTLEEDADVIMFIYRDDYYYPDSEKKGIADIIVPKSRDGKTGTVELCWLSKYTCFKDLEREFKE